MNVEAFKRRNVGAEIGDHRMCLQVIRVGKCEHGETIDACRQLSDGIEPPPTNIKLRSAQRTLLRQIKHLIHPILHSKEDEECKRLEAVADRVRMEELEEDVEDYARPITKKKAPSVRNRSNGSMDIDATNKLGSSVPMDVDPHDDVPSKSSSVDTTYTNTHDTSSTCIGTTVPPTTIPPTPNSQLDSSSVSLKQPPLLIRKGERRYEQKD